MSLEIEFKPLLPKKLFPFPTSSAAQAAVERELKALVSAVSSDMSQYPPEKPSRYTRTGLLGRNWRIRHVTILTWRVYNGVRYAVYVEGPKRGSPRQTRLMAARGWVSISDVGSRRWKQYRPRIIAALQGRRP